MADTVQKLEKEKAETARLTEKLAQVPTESSSALEAENKKLKDELRAAKERYKKMWRLTCEQSREQEEIDRLKRHSKVPTRTPTPTRSLALSHHEHEHTPSECSHDKLSLSGHTSPAKRRGKALPIDSFTGENPEVRIDDWLPVLKRAASWNSWSEAETLIQLSGDLMGSSHPGM